MTASARFVLFAAVALASFAAHAAGIEKPAPEEATSVKRADDYFRYDEDGKHGGSGDFELLVRRFKNPKTGAIVTLAGMIHLAEPAFYAKINTLAEQHDVVLLEGVKGGATFGSIPLLYKVLLANRLIAPARLEGQLDQLRQTGPRYRNADVDIKDLDTGSTAAGDWLAMPLVVVAGETGYALSGISEQLCWLTGNGDFYANKMRGILADALTDPEKPARDEDFERVVVRDRNAVVLKSLDEELAKTGTRRVLIPWGAAHQEGLGEGLRSRGFVAENDEWLRAFSVKHMDTSKETDSGFRWQFPYIACIRISDTTTDLAAPLALLAYKDSPCVYTHSSGWGLIHSRTATANESDFSLLAGILWTGENKPAEHIDSSFALLGLWGHAHTPERDTTRLGWWGFLGGVSTERDDKGAEKSTSWHLPITFGKYPLIYGEKADAVSGKSEHRFLLFFKTTTP